MRSILPLSVVLCTAASVGLIVASDAAHAADQDCAMQRLAVCSTQTVERLDADEFLHERRRLTSGIVLAVRAPPDTMRELVVASPLAQGWSLQTLCNDTLGGVGWEAVAELPAQELVWAALQNESEGQGGDAYILVSADAGRSWQLRACVAPPHWSAIVQGLALQSKRRAELRFAQFDVGEEGPPEGDYVLRTRDAGKSWSQPQRVADAPDPRP